LSVAQSLPEIHKDFIQKCPLCERMNRLVVYGLYVDAKEVKQYPDMGYSFCNCRNIFYTDSINITKPASYEADKNGLITLPDPYFAWPNPYDFLGWDVRRYEILWDMQEYVRELESKGKVIESYWRDMDVQSPTPQTFHIKVKKCQE